MKAVYIQSNAKAVVYKMSLTETRRHKGYAMKAYEFHDKIPFDSILFYFLCVGKPICLLIAIPSFVSFVHLCSFV